MKSAKLKNAKKPNNDHFNQSEIVRSSIQRLFNPYSRILAMAVPGGVEQLEHDRQFLQPN